MYLVAKSYQKAEQIGEVIQKNGKDYITIKDSCDRCGGHGSSSHYSWAVNNHGVCYKCNGKGYVLEEVRVYTEKEFDRMQTAADRAHDKAEKERILKSVEQNRVYKEKYGFENGYIMAILGETYSIKEDLKDQGARFSKAFGWYFFGGFEPEDSEYCLHRIDWEDVSFLSGEYVTLKPEIELRQWFKLQTTEPSNSEFQYEVAEKIQKKLKVVSVHSFDTKYGVTNLHNMVDENENVFIWSTASKLLDVDVIYNLKGTVKDHKAYQDVKQTILTRCSVVK